MMFRFFTLMIPLAIWVGWITIGAWSWTTLLRREMHPHAWPLLALLAVMATGLLLLIGRVSYTLIKQRERKAAWGALCWGTVPFWLMIGHVGFIYITSVQRRIEISPLTLSVLPIAMGLGEFEALIRYPMRTEGDRVVMYHDGLEHTEKIVAEADQYLSHLETVLGTRLRTKIHWIRGTLLGRDSCSFGAFALSSPGQGEIFAHLDRHELAHAAINQFITIESRTPMLLVEGWAEANAEPNAEILREGAARESTWAPSISELVSPVWASIDAGPVYTQGGPFVNQLLSDHGGEKFLNLYTTCRPETFDADCRRNLGVTLSELQTRHETQISGVKEADRVRRLLSSLPVADNVDRADWALFIQEYTDAVDQQEQFDDCEVLIDSTITEPPTPVNQEPIITKQSTRLACAPVGRLLESEKSITAISNRRAFHLSRSETGLPWKLNPPSSPFPAVNRWNLSYSLAANFPRSFYTDFEWQKIWNWSRLPPTLVEFIRKDDGDDIQVQLTFDRESDEHGMNELFIKLTFSRAAGWRGIHRQERHPAIEERIVESQIEYEFKDGRLASVERHLHQTNRKDETKYNLDTSIRIVRPSKITVEDLSPAKYGLDAAVHNESSVVTWPVTVCLIVATVQMVVGIYLARGPRGQ